jgi:hypothetical protein
MFTLYSTANCSQLKSDPVNIHFHHKQIIVKNKPLLHEIFEKYLTTTLPTILLDRNLVERFPGFEHWFALDKGLYAIDFHFFSRARGFSPRAREKKWKSVNLMATRGVHHYGFQSDSAVSSVWFTA